MANKNILLIEPSYKNKYPPLGLMKLAQYHGPEGKRDRVTFVKGETDRTILDVAWDRIYVTSLFSFEWKKIEKAIDFALEASHNQPNKVFVGGIAASLMYGEFSNEPKWHGIRFIKGLLSDAPAVSLKLDDFSGELYSDDQTGVPIEDLIPDYSILDQIDYTYPVRDAYFLYASRGCVRKCKFCGVPVLEGGQRDTGPISTSVGEIEQRYGTRKDLIFMDNNIVASPRFKEIVAEIRDLGFIPGATLKRGRTAPVLRRVDFNQGVDARILSKDKMFLRELSTICIKPLRIAFDHLGVRKPYEQSVRFAHEFGLADLSNYMLYNFHDTPTDLYQRMRLNIELNEQLGIRIFSFPMRYQPTNLKDRSHIGEHWNRYYLRSFQIILQATHGIVSGSPEFFRRAFGEREEDFQSLLLRPHKYIFNRDWYEEFGGKAELDEYLAAMQKLGRTDMEELREFLFRSHPTQFSEQVKAIKNKRVRDAMNYYIPLSRAEERKLWERSKEAKSNDGSSIPPIPSDEIVEDAGLEEVA